MKVHSLGLTTAATVAIVALLGCSRGHDHTPASHASHDHAKDSPSDHVHAAATYQEGRGLSLTPPAAKFIGLQTAEFKIHLPPTALVRTVKGDFVYVENSTGWYLRTPVTLVAPATDAERLAATTLGSRVKDGLYEGDVLVVSGARELWLAELQAINGGVGCAHGH